PWSSASADGCNSSFSSRAGTQPARTVSTLWTQTANCCPTGTPELPVMFRVPWSSASAGGCSSSFSSRAGTQPIRTASTLSKPNYLDRNLGPLIGHVGREGGLCAAVGCLLLAQGGYRLAAP